MAEVEQVDTENSEAKDFPSRPDVLVDIRRMIEQAAAHTLLDREAIDDLLTAVDEAAANAIRHGSPQSGPNAIVHIHCRYTRQLLEVQIRDFGNGFSIPETPVMPAPDATGGRGLPLMVALSDSVSIASTPGGTTITLTKKHA